MHEWVEVTFSYAGWIECSCGFRPQSQEDMDRHVKALARVPEGVQ